MKLPGIEGRVEQAHRPARSSARTNSAIGTAALVIYSDAIKLKLCSKSGYRLHEVDSCTTAVPYVEGRSDSRQGSNGACAHPGILGDDGAGGGNSGHATSELMDAIVYEGSPTGGSSAGRASIGRLGGREADPRTTVAIRLRRRGLPGRGPLRPVHRRLRHGCPGRARRGSYEIVRWEGWRRCANSCRCAPRAMATASQGVA